MDDALLGLVNELALESEVVPILPNSQLLSEPLDDELFDDDLLALADEVAHEDLELNTARSASSEVCGPFWDPEPNELTESSVLAAPAEEMIECALCHELRNAASTVPVRTRRVCQDCYTHLLAEADKRRDQPRTETRNNVST